MMDRIREIWNNMKFKEVKLTYHGHACFTLEYEGAKAVIDPYAWGMVALLKFITFQLNVIAKSVDKGLHSFDSDNVLP